MALTLTSGISATDRTIAITGTVPATIGQGYEFRLDDERLVLTGFTLHLVEHESWDRWDPNPQSWMVRRGVAVAHDAGTAVKAAVDAFVSASDDDPPPTPFASAGGAVTPAEFVEPTTATPEQLADALIAAGLMESS